MGYERHRCDKHIYYEGYHPCPDCHPAEEAELCGGMQQVLADLVARITAYAEGENCAAGSALQLGCSELRNSDQYQRAQELLNRVPAEKRAPGEEDESC